MTFETHEVSKEFVRLAAKEANKFDVACNQAGVIHAIQNFREIGKLHTTHAGERSAYDFSRYGVLARPNENWKRSVLFMDGISIDDFSGVVRGMVITQSPSAADTIRLFRNSVLPKCLTVSPELMSAAQDFDVLGLESLAAIDNGSEFVAWGSIYAYMAAGVILMRVPPGRGDLKGGVERKHRDFESQITSRMDGYVHKSAIHDSVLYEKLLKRAESRGTPTVKEYQEKLFHGAIKLNSGLHPTFGIPRIQVYRNSLELAPPVLITGRVQIRTIFALTFEATLTREGVRVKNLKYNSAELSRLFHVYGEKTVFVKLYPDDIRSVYVIPVKSATPILANCTTWVFEHPLPLELLHVLLLRISKDYPLAIANDELSYVLPEAFNKFKSETEPTTEGTTVKMEVKAATQAAVIPDAKPIDTSNHLDDIRQKYEWQD